jgi:hypothetical protein
MGVYPPGSDCGRPTTVELVPDRLDLPTKCPRFAAVLCFGPRAASTTRLNRHSCHNQVKLARSLSNWPPGGPQPYERTSHDNVTSLVWHHATNYWRQKMNTHENSRTKRLESHHQSQPLFRWWQVEQRHSSILGTAHRGFARMRYMVRGEGGNVLQAGIQRPGRHGKVTDAVLVLRNLLVRSSGYPRSEVARMEEASGPPRLARVRKLPSREGSFPCLG